MQLSSFLALETFARGNGVCRDVVAKTTPSVVPTEREPSLEMEESSGGSPSTSKTERNARKGIGKQAHSFKIFPTDGRFFSLNYIILILCPTEEMYRKARPEELSSQAKLGKDQKVTTPTGVQIEPAENQVTEYAAHGDEPTEREPSIVGSDYSNPSSETERTLRETLGKKVFSFKVFPTDGRFSHSTTLFFFERELSML